VAVPLHRVANPPNPWNELRIEWDEDAAPRADLEVYEEEAGEIVAENTSPDVGFRVSVNPYRGCYHACAYCYARPSHQYLGFGAGTDFDRRIVVKVNAPEALRRTFDRKSWRGETLAFSGNTDCYQPLEASYQLTRRCLEACLDYRNPVIVITKSALVRRDARVLAELARVTRVRAFLSIPFSDASMARAVEPHASSPELRFSTLRALSEAGVPVGVSVSPVIPGLNEPQIPEILERARASGARWAFSILLRLPSEVLPVFDERMARAFPLRIDRMRHAVREMRGGQWNEAAFGARMKGVGERWKAVRGLFELHCRRLGLNVEPMGSDDDPASPRTFRRPTPQGDLFRTA
jgi:DNA repair photolyase